MEEATPEGLLAIGGDLEVSTLQLAYSQGIFPWPYSERSPITWFSPDPRGVLFYKQLHLPHSLKKLLRKSPFHFKINTQFSRVIEHCAQAKRPKQRGTWISAKILEAYKDFHRAGHAFSFEAYDASDNLAGGIYGINQGMMVAGESMFYLQDNASKASLVALMMYLKNFGIDWIDTQMKTEVVSSLGGVEIPRSQFIPLLKKSVAQKKPAGLFQTTQFTLDKSFFH